MELNLDSYILKHFDFLNHLYNKENLYNFINISNYICLYYISNKLSIYQSHKIYDKSFNKITPKELFYNDYSNWKILDINHLINVINKILIDFDKRKISLLDKNYIFDTIKINLKDKIRYYNIFLKNYKSILDSYDYDPFWDKNNTDFYHNDDFYSIILYYKKILNNRFNIITNVSKYYRYKHYITEDDLLQHFYN